MRPSALGRAFLALVLLASATPARAQSFAWWKNDQFQKDVGITSEQSTRIDSIFQATWPKLRQDKEELDRQEAEISRLIEANADEADVSRQIDKAEAIRARLNKMRTLMVLHMYQKLTPEQRVKFKPTHDQWLRDHPPSRPPMPAQRSGGPPQGKF